MSQERIDEELASVERIVRSLAPSTSSLDFPQVMYLAGRASAMAARARYRGRSGWIWPCVAVVSLLLAVMFATAWTFSGSREVVERVVYVEKKEPTAVSQEPIDVTPATLAPSNPWQQYARLRHFVLSQGIEGLPEPDLRPLSDLGSPPWAPFGDAALGAWPEG